VYTYNTRNSTCIEVVIEAMLTYKQLPYLPYRTTIQEASKEREWKNGMREGVVVASLKVRANVRG
jgi:hypothetical protein